MHLTAFSDYALRVLIYLSIDYPNLATIPRIAAAYGISENHLMKVVHHLVRTGVVESTRGKGGGIRLARRPEDIRAGQVIKAIEGTAPVVECLGEEESACCIAPACRLSGILDRAFGAFYGVLDEYTLADIAGNRRALKQVLMLAPQA